MRGEKGWLQAQMESAKREMSGWRGWKQDTIRKEISTRLSAEARGDYTLVRSSGKWTVKDRVHSSADRRRA
jgi:hypothetical protein